MSTKHRVSLSPFARTYGGIPVVIGLAAAVVLIVVLTVLASSSPVRAGGQVFHVDTNLDGPDKNPGDGICDQNLFLCTLRAAVMEANALPGPDTIMLSSDTYILTRAGADDTAVAGDLDITDDLTIQGVGPGSTIIDAGGIDRVLHIDPLLSGINVEINGLTVQNGSANYGGGIAFWDGSLTLNNVNITNNSATFNAAGMLAAGVLTYNGGTVSGNNSGEDGGGIFFAGASRMANVTLSGNSGREGGGIYNSVGTNLITSLIVGSTLSDNQATNGSGGGIYNNSGTLSIDRSTLVGNSATSGGGGIKNVDTAELINTTVSGNSAPAGGGIENRDTLTATNVTIADNTAPVGGGIYNSGSLTLVNTITANNLGGGDCFAPGGAWAITPASSHSLDSDGSCGLAGPGDLSNTDPVLGPLANYGGATDVYPLRSHSPAVDAGDGGPCPFTDQRGGIRPQDGDDDLLFECDIGAFELQTVCGGDGTVLSPPDVPIPDSDPGGVNSTVSWGPGLGTIVDLNLCVAIPHTWVGDLIVTLTHQDTGTTATVIDRPGKTNGGFGCGGDDIFVLLDDEAGLPVENECAAQIPSISGNFAPNNPLSAFDGEDISGNWTLTVSDNEADDIGVLDRWDLLPQLVEVTPSPTQTGASTPTPTPGTPTPTPTPTSSGAPPSSKPTATPAATPTPSSLPTSPPTGQEVAWGDHNCSGEADPVDSLLTLRYDAGLSTNTGDCPDFGQVVDVQNASPHPWGDVDCGGNVTPVDSLKLLRYDAGLSVSQAVDCPPIGSAVLITS